MLKKENRLTKKKDFENVFKNGRGAKCGLLYLKYIKNGLKTSRFGIVVSKSFSKKAVERNKIRRRIREIICGVNGEKSYDVVVVVMPGAKNDYEALNRQIAASFKKLRLAD